jgi:C4-dicarboxylate-specific signal transduction histidine kinase
MSAMNEMPASAPDPEKQSADLRQTRKELETAIKINCCLEELNGTLEVCIANTAGDLRHKDEMMLLQNRRAVMGNMINNIAHQWQQPLNLLKHHLQQLPLLYNSAELSRDFLNDNTIKALILFKQMSHTIEDFRMYFKADREQFTFNINKVINQAVSLIARSFEDQQIRIDLDTDGELLVSGYPNEYTHVLLNILMNARDVLVERHVADAVISIHSCEESGVTVVTITDNAGGIAEELIATIFNNHFSTSGQGKGTGIGLYLSKTIIENSMKGSLTARNTATGAEFRIEL